MKINELGLVSIELSLLNFELVNYSMAIKFDMKLKWIDWFINTSFWWIKNYHRCHHLLLASFLLNCCNCYLRLQLDLTLPPILSQQYFAIVHSLFFYFIFSSFFCFHFIHFRRFHEHDLCLKHVCCEFKKVSVAFDKVLDHSFLSSHINFEH